jgi:hypothetical protein
MKLRFDEEQLRPSCIRPISLLLNPVFVEELRFVDQCLGTIIAHLVEVALSVALCSPPSRPNFELNIAPRYQRIRSCIFHKEITTCAMLMRA